MINVLQIITSVLLVVLVLLQERSSGLSGVLGGSSGTPYQSRRGMEKLIFRGTIFTAFVFVLLVLVDLLL